MTTTAHRLSVEVAWPIRRGRVKPDHGYALFGALCRAGLVFHGQPDTIVLPPHDYLVIRCPEDRAWRLAGGGLNSLRLDGERCEDLELGLPMVRPLVPSPSLKAWCVTIKGMTCDSSLREAALRQFALLGIDRPRLRVLSRRIVRLGSVRIVGYGVRLDGFDEHSSLIVQSRGIGGRLRMGCGGFVPC